MRRLMADFDLDVEDAAAILGNLGHESAGFTELQEEKPTVKGSRGGYGWAQWTGPRRKAYERFCKENDLDPASDEANYGYLKYELEGPESAAIDRVKRAEDLRDKVIQFELGFERAGVKHYNSRVKYAVQAMAAFKKRGPPTEASMLGGMTGEETDDPALPGIAGKVKKWMAAIGGGSFLGSLFDWKVALVIAVVGLIIFVAMVYFPPKWNRS